jgi:membrane protein YqaA with SNARE-associated domain
MDSLVTWVAANGPWALLLVSFLAATLLPLSSEAALVGALKAGAAPLACLVAASVGNVAACLVNYALGAWARASSQERLERSRVGRAALSWLERLGLWALLLSWLPVLGDPLTVAAGVARVPMRWFLPLVAVLRVGRYALIFQFLLAE